MITPPVVNDNIGTGGVYDALHKVIIHQHIIIYMVLLLLVRGAFLLSVVWSVSNNNNKINK